MMSGVPAWTLYPRDVEKPSDSRSRQADVHRLRIPQRAGTASASPVMDPRTESMCRLMERYAEGDDAVFDQLYRELAPRLYRFCLRLANRTADADDCFQETFLKMHRARATYASGSNPLHWTFAIARSVYLSRMRYWRRRPERLGDVEDIADRGDLHPQESVTPETASMAEDLLNVAATALDRMPESQRMAYILMKEEGLTAKEAAAVLGTTEESVRQRAHRAYERMRRALTIEEQVGEAGYI